MKQTISITLELEDGPRHAQLRRVAEIAARLRYIVAEEWTADNTGSCEATMRHDGLEGPYVTESFIADGAHVTPKEIAEFKDAVNAASEAANGDSNDAEIEALQNAVDVAESLLCVELVDQ